MRSDFWVQRHKNIFFWTKNAKKEKKEKIKYRFKNAIDMGELFRNIYRFYLQIAHIFEEILLEKKTLLSVVLNIYP